MAADTIPRLESGDCMMTFAELGIPFPLFEAPTSEASHYVGLSTCSICGVKEQHTFHLRVGCAVILRCSCGAENGLNTSDRKDIPCRGCGDAIPVWWILGDDPIDICYPCLRAGKGAITKDTEFGMVSWEQAFQGITHGAPGLRTDQFELVEIDPEEDWYGVRVPNQHLFELLRTPTFSSWQGERWLFCCKRPMTYVGDWQHVNSTLRPSD